MSYENRSCSSRVSCSRLPSLVPFAALAVVLAAPGIADAAKVQYHPTGLSSTSVTDNQIMPWIRILNDGASALTLSTLTVRYWYTEEGTQSQSWFCDYWSRGCTNVTSKFVKMSTPTTTADTYVELGFTSGAGSLAAGQSTDDIQSRITKSDWSTYNEANDYSYDGTKTAATDWTHVTLYQNGTLIWGTEPTGGVTCAAAPSAPAVTATAMTTSSIGITWSAVVPPSNCSVTYNVYRSTTSGFTPSASNQVASGLTGTSSTSTGLNAGTTYYFIVQAVDAAGSANSAQLAASTQVTTCAAAPSAPTVTATAASSAAINLTWTAVTAPSNCSVTYSVYRSTTSGFTPSASNQIASGVTATSSTSTGLTASMTYYFIVQAVDAAGATSSAQASATTQSGGGKAALKVQYHVGTAVATTSQVTPLLRIVNAGSASVPLSTLTIRYWFTAEGSAALTYWCDYWASGCGNVTSKFGSMGKPAATADTYLEIGFTSGAGSVAAGGSTQDIQGRFAKSDWSTFNQTNDWSYDGTKLGPSDWGHVTLYQNGVLVWGLEPGVDTTPPSVPDNLAATPNSVSITLTWTASTDDTGVTGYDVYKGSALDGSTTTTTYKASGLSPNTAYSFTVRARDAYGNVSNPSAALSVTTSGPDTTPPSVPTGLKAVSVTATSASITWSPSTDDVGAAAYDVYNGAALAGSAMTTSYTVLGLSPSTTYSLSVRARDAAGNVSGASAALAVSTPASGGGSYALDPPDFCYSYYVVPGCTEGVAGSTCGGHCRVANACSPPEDPQKVSLPMTFACPRFMAFSDEMLQAAKDDWGDPAPFVYGVVGHDIDAGGIDGSGSSSCCQCYQLVFESGELAISSTDPVAIPKSMIVQSFNTAAGGPKNFDIFMGAGGFGAFNACVPGTYAGAQTTNFGHFMYSAFPTQYPTDGGIKAVNLDQCKANSMVSATSLAFTSCQNTIAGLCGNTAAASSTVAAETINSCIATNAPTSFYHQNWHVRAKRVECPTGLTRVTGCQLAPQRLPQADPKAQTAATASGFATGYTTTTMQDCCKPSCAWSDQVAGAGLTPVGKWGSFYSCDQNGVPITAP